MKKIQMTDLEFNAKDDADRSAAMGEFHLRRALAQRKPEGPVATGYCLHCDEPLPAEHRWCDSDCRDAWEKHNG